MSNIVKGKLKVIYDEKHISENFNTREFVVTIGEETPYPQHVIFTATNSNADQLIGKRPGDIVEVFFNLRGREWKGHADGVPRYYTTLEAYRIYKDDAI